MTRARKDVEGGLLAKGFQQSESHHHYFLYHDLAGRKTAVKTKTSHAGKDLDDSLLGLMARQVRLSKKQFLDLLDCPLTREAYDRIVGKSNGTGEVPP
jgi:predicted RNA binding protein YcfA (HicA-like mRNA interferase family)